MNKSRRKEDVSNAGDTVEEAETSYQKVELLQVCCNDI